MNKLLLAATLASACFVPCSPAQTTAPASKEAPPAGPWVAASAGDLARWNIEYRYTDAPNRAKAHADAAARVQQMSRADPAYAKMIADNPGMLIALDPPRILQAVITKTHSLKEQKMMYEGGQTGERWNDGTVEMNLLPGSKQITVDFALGGPTSGDFPEFDWLATENFQGRKHVGNQDLLIFQKNIPALKITNPRLYNGLATSDPLSEQVTTLVPVTATVDVSTHLPVSLQVGDEIHLYSFLAGPAEMLVLPDDFATAAKQIEGRFREMHKPHPLP